MQDLQSPETPNAPPAAVDGRLVAALLEMARELWVTRERQRILEQLLAATGALPPDAIDHHEPSEEAQAQSERECRAFVDRIVTAIMTDDTR